MNISAVWQFITNGIRAKKTDHADDSFLLPVTITSKAFIMNFDLFFVFVHRLNHFFSYFQYKMMNAFN